MIYKKNGISDYEIALAIRVSLKGNLLNWIHFYNCHTHYTFGFLYIVFTCQACLTEYVSIPNFTLLLIMNDIDRIVEIMTIVIPGIVVLNLNLYI